MGASKKYILRDYWLEDYSHRPYQSLVHTLNDRIIHHVSEIIAELCAQEGVKDGDEFEITVTRTGRRPAGERRIIWQEANTYGLETDEQYADRLAGRVENRHKQRKEGCF